MCTDIIGYFEIKEFPIPRVDYRPTCILEITEEVIKRTEQNQSGTIL